MIKKALTNTLANYKILNIHKTIIGEVNLTEGLGDHTLTGGLGADLFVVTGTDTITNLGLGSDDVYVAPRGIARITLAGDFTATAATINNGSVQIMTNGFDINLKAVKQGTHGFTILNNGSTPSSIIASNKSDTILCGLENDTLTGAGGTDNFLFNTSNYTAAKNTTPHNHTAYPIITDFNSNDKIKFQVPENGYSRPTSPAIFNKFGQLKSTGKVFYASSDGLAINSKNRILYNTTTGELSFDTDGNGSTDPIIIAQLGINKHFNLQANNIVILANKEETGTVTISDINLSKDQTFNGQAYKGQTLIASNTFVDPNGIGSLVTYQWLANGKVISGATGLTLTLLSPYLLDKKISVRATYTDLIGTLENHTSKATAPVVIDTKLQPIDLVLKQAVQDSTITVSFADINAQAKSIIDAKTFAIDPQANSIYPNDPILKFDVEGIATGTLLIGTDYNSATPWNPISNHIIDATHQAYWKPDSLTNNPNIFETGYLTAFKVIGKNNSFQVAIQEIVTVTPVNHTPVFVVDPYVAQPKALTNPITINEAIAVTNGKLNAIDYDNGSFISYGLKNGIISSDGFSISHTNAYGTLTIQRGTGKYTYTPDISAIKSSSSEISAILNETVTVSDKIAPIVKQQLTISTQIKYISGDSGNNALNAINGNNIMVANAGNDSLKGGTGSDILVGGSGTDTLTGGSGKSVFVFNAITESTVGSNRDIITNFTHSKGDLIDLSSIDANANTAGNQPFRFIGSNAFLGQAGELNYVNGIVSGDINGDKIADFQIAVTLVGTTTLVSADFIL